MILFKLNIEPRTPKRLLCPVCDRILVRRRYRPRDKSLSLPIHMDPVTQSHCGGSQKLVRVNP